MKIDHFDPPGNIDDLGNDAGLKERWSKEMSGIFDDSIERVTQFLQRHGGGTCQFYNPVAGGRTDPDLVPSLGDIPWNGFPKRFGATGPTHPTNFAAAEPKRIPVKRAFRTNTSSGTSIGIPRTKSSRFTSLVRLGIILNSSRHRHPIRSWLSTKNSSIRRSARRN
jgi:hypothetical protein